MTLKKASVVSNKTTLSSNSNNPYYILPTIDKNIINSAYQKSNSVLSKYINTQVKSFYREAKSFKESSYLFQKQKKNLYKSITKTESNELGSNKNIKLYLTSQDDKAINSDLKKDNRDDNPNINLTDVNNIVKEKKVKRIDSSISIDKTLTKNQFEIANSTFHRVRSYKPKISKNWKLNNGVSVGNSKVNSMVPMDGEYQSNIFNDQFKLMIDNYHYYKMKILANTDFMNAFKTLNLKSQIEFNKSLEEICGLLILLPRHILAEFFKYIEYLKCPDKSRFKEKYIFDEVSCLYQNNSLLSETFDYFQNSFEIYLLLVKEVEGMILKQNDFESTLSVFERIRFDFTLISNIAENALFNYIKDMGTLCKLKRYSSEYSKLNNMIFATKMKNYKSQNKTKERQRKLRIDDCLSNHYNIDIKMNKKFKGNRKFKSLMETKLISNLLEHCRKEVKYNIQTERINNEFDTNDRDNLKYKNKPIKINF